MPQYSPSLGFKHKRQPKPKTLIEKIKATFTRKAK